MTQTQLARENIITTEMEQAAAYEDLAPEFIREGLANGTIIIPKNINHEFPARAIGKGLITKINANIGTSEVSCNLPAEISKLNTCLKFGAHSVMDLSTGGDLSAIRKKLLTSSSIMFGTVPIYAVATKLFREEKDIADMVAEELFSEIELQAEQGVDFITVHCGITKSSIKTLDSVARLMGVVSRGGSILVDWIKKTGNENPLYEYYDRLLEIAEKYDVTISLGDGLRPGSLFDASDKPQISELLILGELVQRAQERGVQVMVEGPGHIPLNEIEMNVRLQKSICNNAPFYVLGPLVTDIAPGYDHITGAIGGALATSFGTDFLCYVTPSEHLCLPNEDDVKQGIIASRIAAHSGDIIKGVKNARKADDSISKARRELNWPEIFKHAIDPELARKRKEETQTEGEDYCSMCGSLCAVKINRGEKR